MKIINAGNQKAVDALLARDRRADRTFEGRVRGIVERVRVGGDRVLIGFASRFDGATAPLEVSAEEMREQSSRVDPAVRRAIRQAAQHIARVASRQVPKQTRVTVAPGVIVEQRVEPLTRVGCYVPGGRFPLPSSLLMTAVPARIAGVPEVLVVCPRPEPAVMAAALEAGVTRLFRVGGAHAVAALAYGTETVPRVDKIVGPGTSPRPKPWWPPIARSISTPGRRRS
jgi:histidinol dehydrogenase